METKNVEYYKEEVKKLLSTISLSKFVYSNSEYHRLVIRKLADDLSEFIENIDKSEKIENIAKILQQAMPEVKSIEILRLAIFFEDNHDIVKRTTHNQ